MMKKITFTLALTSFTAIAIFAQKNAKLVTVNSQGVDAATEIFTSKFDLVLVCLIHKLLV
jgi:hypothetical protein